MRDKVLATIKKFNMIESGDNIIVGLSGGADSVCLLLVLNEIKDILDICLYGIHVHHGLRGEDADKDAKFSQELCEKLNIPIKVVYRNIRNEAKKLKISEEEAGRKARYEIFEKKKNELGKAKIAIGHHMNDQAETVLFNIIRGSGLKGIGGIRPVRDSIIRPLIECTRREIEEYCNNKLISFRHDISNESDIYSRNKLRLHVIPYIEDNFNPSFIKQISVMSELVREDDLCLDKIATKFLNHYLIKTNPNKIYLDISKLMELDKAIRKRVFRKAILNINPILKDYEHKHIVIIEELLSKETGKKIMLPYGIIVEKIYNNICFRKEELIDYPWEYLVKIGEGSINIKEINGSFKFRVFENHNFTDFPKSRYTKWFDYDKMISNLTIRNRREGDYIYLKRLNGKKSLKNFFVDEKIPRENRGKIALLAEKSNIIWIVGYRINEHYKVTNNTKKILEIIYTQEE